MSGDFTVGQMIAYQGKADCDNPMCRRLIKVDPVTGGLDTSGPCLGWHCPVCDEPCSMYGHKDCGGES